MRSATHAVDVLIDEEDLHARVAAWAQDITRDYQGKELALIGVLKGCFIFWPTWSRAIDLPLTVDFLGITSYQGDTETTGVVRITSDVTQPIAGKHVLLVEDIVDTGLTMRFLLENLATRHPASREGVLAAREARPGAGQDRHRLPGLRHRRRLRGGLRAGLGWEAA